MHKKRWDSETILPFSCCPLVFFSDFGIPRLILSKSPSAVPTEHVFETLSFVLQFSAPLSTALRETASLIA